MRMTFVVMTLILAGLSVQAGTISSGGVRGDLFLNCQNADNTVRLNVGVVNNDRLEARLEDYSQTKSVSIYSSEVSMTNHSEGEAYDGEKLQVLVDYFGAARMATVIVKSLPEWLVYSDLICLGTPAIK